MVVADELSWIATEEIARAVRQQTGEPAMQVGSWTSERLVRGGGRDAGVWRLHGNGTVNGAPRPWSIVVKGWGSPAGDADPSSFQWPDREMELYSSGILSNLPAGIRAPTCYGTFRREDGSAWVWLEDLSGEATEPSGLADYAIVARRIGQFNGAYLDGTPLPQHRALSLRWTRQWTGAAGSSLDILVREARHPLVRQVYPPHVTETYLRLWPKRDRLFARLDPLPLTFCHLDVFHRNILMGKADGSPTDVILVDWSFSGIGHLGEDVATFVPASTVFLESPMEQVDDLRDAVIEGYIDGLRDRGWAGDDRHIREAYLISMAMRHGVGAIRVMLWVLLGEWAHTEIERMLGRPIDEILSIWAGFHEWLTRQVREHDALFG